MIIKCDNCGKDFDRSTNKVNESIKNGWKQYCCPECVKKGKTKKIKCNCAHCGTELLKDPAQIKRSKTGNMFCNTSCAASYNNSHFRTKENNPNWKGGTYSRSSSQTIAYRTYEHKCSICGFNEFSALQVHHIDEDPFNNDIDNLIILCANHHSMIHYGNLEITEEIKQKRLGLKD